MVYYKKLERFDFPKDCSSKCYPTSVILKPGKYNITCHGASGGNSSVPGGAGGFASGILDLTKRIEFFVFIGQEGNPKNSTAFNGGGRGSKYSSSGAGGGGGTDIRLTNKSDFEGLRSRIIVAGGGGGAERWGYGAQGGAGGGLVGCNGKKSSNLMTMSISYGGTQTAGGKRGQVADGEHRYNGFSGTFGQGGNGPDYKYGGGGGGGYFGGGGGSINDQVTGSGAGGSSYVSGHHGCYSMNDDQTLTNNPVHYSGIQFTNSMILSGEQFAHYGNGFVTIAWLYNKTVKPHNTFSKLLYFVFINSLNCMIAE